MSTNNDKTLTKVEGIIRSEKDDMLRASGYIDRLMKDHSRQVPKLEENRTSVSITNQIIDHHNAPHGLAYTPGKKMDIVTYTIPYVGRTEVMAEVLRKYAGIGNPAIGSGAIEINFYENNIDGNPAAVEAFNTEIKSKVAKVKSAIDTYKTECIEYDEKTLKPFIESTIKDEIAKRDDRGNTLKGLNPFA